MDIVERMRSRVIGPQDCEDAALEIERLREVLRALLDRNLTYSGSDVIMPFASHGIAVSQIAEARRLMVPNA